LNGANKTVTPEHNPISELRNLEELAFRRRALRTVGIAVGIVVISAALIWFFILRVPPPSIVTLDDCSKTWHFTHRSSFLYTEQLSVHVRGHLDGHALFYVSTYDRFVDQSQPKELGPGDVDFTYSALEWWCGSCTVLYKPTDVTSGNLKVTIQIQ
jgi:hypothetical protein